MARKLQVSAIECQVDDAVRHLLLFVAGPFAFEIQNFCVEIQRTMQITDFNYWNDLHDGLYSVVPAQRAHSRSCSLTAYRVPSNCRWLRTDRRRLVFGFAFADDPTILQLNDSVSVGRVSLGVCYLDDRRAGLVQTLEQLHDFVALLGVQVD